MTIWDKVDKMSNEGGFPKVEEGTRYLRIIEAQQDDTDPASPKYKITAKDLDNGARVWLTYFLAGKSSGSVKATLNTLRDAIFGAGLLEPVDDIKGAVIGAEVRLNDKGYPRVYEFFAAPRELVETYSEMDDQYWAHREDEE